MKLRDKFRPLVWFNSGSFNVSQNREKDENSIKCDEIAGEYAIEFAEWCCSRYTKLHSVWCPIFGDQRDKNNWKTTNQLLEIFKKEKGL